ncbi:hypothetical protein pipiens_004872 [Culex pipiens pipiens]|uniref:SPRY domain-containing SOCS box protein 3 n=1 Tax=Culex pipiens pipiens TaxID=38569 RepID=A0ABD1CDW4_CULPP
MTIQEGRNAKQPTSHSIGSGSHLATSTSTTNNTSRSNGVLSAFFGSLTAGASAARSASHHNHHQPSAEQQEPIPTPPQHQQPAIAVPVVEEAAAAAVAMVGVASDNNNQQPFRGERPLQNGCEDKWSWSKRDRSKEVWLSGANNRTVHFHPNWSKGTAGIRGTRVLNNGRYYWELSVSQRVFGTSMMFGIGTKKARLHVNAFTNLLGEDKNGWGLSHKGLLWHGGIARNYTKRFKENQATRIGILFDGVAGTLTYYKDDVCLGIAFRGLNEIREPLYPVVCSTAAKTEMVLTESRRDFVNLQDRCRAVIIKHIKTREKLDRLNLPYCITNYLAEALSDCTTPVTPLEQQLIDYYLF